MKYSIRTAMFATTAASLLFAAAFFPNQSTACAIVFTFVMAISIAWLFVIEQWPQPAPWTLGFAISGVCLSLSNLRIPWQWMDQLIAWQRDWGESSGFQSAERDIEVIFNYGIIFLLAVIFASILARVRPKRLQPLAVVVIVLLTIFATWFLSNAVLFCVLIASSLLLSWTWFVITQQPLESSRWLLAFAIATTAASFCLKMELLSADTIDLSYGLQHTPPDKAGAMRFEMRLYSEILRLPMVLLLGSLLATLFQGIIRRNVVNS